MGPTAAARSTRHASGLLALSLRTPSPESRAPGPGLCGGAGIGENGAEREAFHEATTETRQAMADLAVDNVLAVLDVEPALTPVNGPLSRRS
jgi:hypothetical protein